MLEIVKTILASPFEVIIFMCGFFAFLMGVLPIRGKLNGLPLEGPFAPATRHFLWGTGLALMLLSIGMSFLKTYTPQPVPVITPTPLPAATFTPTATPSPTPTPTLTPTPTPTPVCRYDAFVTDEGRYPNPREGPLFPGQPMIVKWTITNKSTCAWVGGLRWTFTGSEAIGVPPSRPIGKVGIGESILIYERILAPNTPGRYSGWWQMKDPAGNPFGDRSYIEIDVQELSLPPSPPNCTNHARFIADLTYEDNPEHGIIPVVKPGEKIYKAWLLKNTGTCHWDKGYSLAYVGGAKMAWESPYVSPTISGGKAVVLVTLFAPNTPGEYKMEWRLQDPQGNLFEETFWVWIRVQE